jgi:hypothetical protein
MTKHPQLEIFVRLKIHPSRDYAVLLQILVKMCLKIGTLKFECNETEVGTETG